MTDSLAALEQISYLILLRTLELRSVHSDESAVARAFAASPSLRWRTLRTLPGGEMLRLFDLELVRFLVSAVESDRFAQAMRGATLGLREPGLVRNCVEAVDRLEIGDTGEDSAEIYDALLSRLLASTGEAQLSTPRPLVEAMVDLADPEADQVICDPAAGTASLLIEANRRVGDQADGLVGYDLNASMVRLGLINMLLHGIPDPEMVCEDTLSRGFEWPAADVVISHPPFGGGLDHRDLSPDLELSTSRADVLFLELCRRLLRSRGRAVVLVPEGVLFAGSQAQTEVRRRWLTRGRIDAVISLPPEILGRQANVKTALLLLAARGGTERVWFGQLDGEPASLMTGVDSLPADLLPHLAEAVRWRLGDDRATPPTALALGRTMWDASIDEIGENGWSLAPATYRRGKDLPSEDEDPLKVLDDVEGLEVRIRDELAGVRASLESPR
ncbi:MAG TPA: N-6 DNA methylase [Solirubrobacterales bacterium]